MMIPVIIDAALDTEPFLPVRLVRPHSIVGDLPSSLLVQVIPPLVGRCAGGCNGPKQEVLFGTAGRIGRVMADVRFGLSGAQLIEQPSGGIRDIEQAGWILP